MKVLKNPSGVSNIISITLVLIVLGTLSLILSSAQKISNHLKENVEVAITLKSDSDSLAIQQFRSRMGLRPRAPTELEPRSSTVQQSCALSERHLRPSTARQLHSSTVQQPRTRTELRPRPPTERRPCS